MYSARPIRLSTGLPLRRVNVRRSEFRPFHAESYTQTSWPWQSAPRHWLMRSLAADALPHVSSLLLAETCHNE